MSSQVQNTRVTLNVVRMIIYSTAHLQNSCQETTEVLPRDHRTLVNRLHNSCQKSCQETTTKMIERLSFLLQCITVTLLGDATYYLHSLLKLAEATINELLTEPPESDVKRQKLIKCVLTRKSKQYLRKAYTEERRIKELNAEEVDKLFSIYEAKLLGQMVVMSLGKSIIRMYSVGTCAVLGISNQDALIADLESDPFLNSALERFTCEMYYRFSSFLAPLSVELITNRHY